MTLSIVTACRLSAPGAMPPWEQDDEELVDNIGVRNVEVMLEGRDIDIAIELRDYESVLLLRLSSQCRGY